jgi:hypothetical protein
MIFLVILRHGSRPCNRHTAFRTASEPSGTFPSDLELERVELQGSFREGRGNALCNRRIYTQWSTIIFKLYVTVHCTVLPSTGNSILEINLK